MTQDGEPEEEDYDSDDSEAGIEKPERPDLYYEWAFTGVSFDQSANSHAAPVEDGGDVSLVYIAEPI